MNRSETFVSGLRLPERLPPRLAVAPVGHMRPVFIRNEVYFPIIDDQGRTGMCASYSYVGGVQAFRWRELDLVQNLDERPLYDAACVHAGQIDPKRQKGLRLEDVLSVSDAVLPVKIATAVQITDPEDMPWFIQHYGWIYAGLNITEGWMYAGLDGRVRSGVDPISGRNYDVAVGGHAVPIAGYDLKRDMVIIPNSWGTSAGCGGLFVLTLEQFRKQFIYGYGVRFLLKS